MNKRKIAMLCTVIMFVQNCTYAVENDYISEEGIIGSVEENVILDESMSSEDEEFLLEGHEDDGYKDSTLITQEGLDEEVIFVEGSFEEATPDYEEELSAVEDPIDGFFEDGSNEILEIDASGEGFYIDEANQQEFMTLEGQDTLNGMEESESGEGIILEEDFLEPDASLELQVEELASGSCGDTLSWSLDSEGTLTISGSGEMSDFNNSSVPWQDFQNQIKRCILPEGLTNIGSYAFSNCQYLERIDLPDDITKIGGSSFQNCTKLIEIVIPDSVVEIDKGAFVGCRALANVKFPDNLKILNTAAFLQCTNLISAQLPDSIENLGMGVFQMCSKLEYVHIPEGLTCIPDILFSGCNRLATVEIPSTVNVIKRQAFGSCASLKEIKIPENVVTIESEAFLNCANLESIIIPQSVTGIGERAFLNCMNLKNLIFSGNCPTIASDCFSGDLLTIYHKEDESFNENTMLPYGGTVTWVAIERIVDTEPTCVDTGHYAHWKYTDSGKLYLDFFGKEEVSEEDVVIPALGHKEEVLPSVVATCTETGLTEGKKCSVCGAILETQEVVPALGHKEENIPTVAASCTKAGLTEGKKCSVCGKTLAVQEIIPALGHDFGEWVVTKEATEEEEGEMARTCNRCEETEISTIEKLAHIHVIVIDDAVAPTCEMSGLTEGSHCSKCGETIKAQSIIPALGHKEEIIPSVATTCTEPGLTEGKKCTICGEILVAQAAIPALGHTEEVLPAVNATCKDAGLTEGKKCTVCGEILKAQVTIPAFGHKEEIIPAMAATCTGTGLTEGKKCSVCGQILNEQKEIAALGHSWDEGSILKYATAEETGLKQYTCKVCGYTKDEQIEKIDDSGIPVLALGELYTSTWTLSDWLRNHLYKFVLKEPGIVNISASKINNGSIFFSVLNAARQPIWNNDGTLMKSDEHNMYFLEVGLDRGVYYLSMVPLATVSSSYMLFGVSSMSTNFVEMEPNENKSTATEMVLDHPYYGSIGSEYNTITTNYETEDYFKVYLEAGKYYKIGVSDLDNSSLTLVQMISPSGRTDDIRFLLSKETDSNWFTYYYQADTSGYYYIRFYNNTLKYYEYKVKVENEIHNWNSWKTTKVTSCTVNGTRVRSCSICKKIETQSIPSIGHKPVTDVAVAATCTAPGKTVGSHCAVCGTVLTAPKTTVALGHKWDAGKVTKEPTVSAEGVKTYTCTVCGGTKTEGIAKLTAEEAQKKAEGDPSDPKSVAGAEKAMTQVKDTGEPRGSSFSTIQLQSTRQTKNSITLKWNKVKGATGYIVYGSPCGTKNKLQRISKQKKTSFVHKKLKKGTYYKFTVAAYKSAAGKEEVIGSSKMIHVATAGGKVTNVKKVTGTVKNRAVKKLSLKAKKTTTIKAKETLQNKKLKLKRHRVIKYESSNTRIATVTAQGRLKAKRKGKCFIYIYSQNGVFAKLIVNVK